MLLQRCTLEQHRLTVPVSVTRPYLEGDEFRSRFSGSRYRGLIDTGAQRSVASRAIISEQDLLRTGHMQFASLHGPRTHSRYLAGIGLWVRRIDHRDQSARYEDAELSLFAIEQPFEVVDMEDNENFDLIVGFDVLKAFDFSFDSRSQTFELLVKG